MTPPTTQSVELLPCPFCGSDAVGVVEFIDGDGDRVVAVGCRACECNGTPHIPLMDDARPAAIASWNRRATLRAALKSALTAGEVNHE